MNNFPSLTFLTTRQLSEKYQAWPIGTLKELAANGNCPAMIRIKTHPENERAKIIWCAEIFQLWILSDSQLFNEIIEEYRDSIRAFFKGLSRVERGRPRSLKVAK